MIQLKRCGALCVLLRWPALLHQPCCGRAAGAGRCWEFQHLSWHSRKELNGLQLLYPPFSRESAASRVRQVKKRPQRIDIPYPAIQLHTENSTVGARKQRKFYLNACLHHALTHSAGAARAAGCGQGRVASLHACPRMGRAQPKGTPGGGETKVGPIAWQAHCVAGWWQWAWHANPERRRACQPHGRRPGCKPSTGK